MRFALLAIALLACASCTDEQIARAQAISDQTDAKLARANEAVAKAEQALATAKDLADKLGSEQGQRVVAQAAAALEQVKSAQAIVVTTDDAVHSALKSAKDSQAAGGSSVSVIGAAALGFLPGALAALKAGLQWWSVLKSYRQTVSGLDKAKESLAADPTGVAAKAWDDHIAPALDAAHDASTRKLVANIQAKDA
jgi:hypothetical protein